MLGSLGEGGHALGEFLELGFGQGEDGVGGVGVGGGVGEGGGEGVHAQAVGVQFDGVEDSGVEARLLG